MQNNDFYRVPSESYRSKIELKRSLFVSSVFPVNGKPEALQSIELVRREFPDANHHCWAMVAGAPDDVYQQDQSDDGEPKGTAGKPMLNVLQHSGLGKTVLVVTRYFGGIKLGAGGLVRAYTQAATTALAETTTRKCFVCETRRVVLAYNELDEFEYWLAGTDIETIDKEFADNVVLNLSVPISQLNQLDNKLLLTSHLRSS